jgi:hypothetical protein
MKNRITLLKATMIGAITCQLIICHISIVHAKVHLHVYEADGKTLFDNREIMVDTELTLVVSSDNTNFWSGGLFISGYDRALASLSARAFDPNSRDWVESHLEAAGENAKLTEWKDSDIWGFDLYTSDSNSVAGDWFIIDYKAIDVGDPNVGFYEYDVSWNDPNGFVYFSHIPTRDFNNDKVVNISDYSILASYWLAENCYDPNWCDKTDIDTDGDVDIDDLSLFLDYWMWRNPSLDSLVHDPNVIFSVIDANSLAEVTMNVGEEITFYVNMTTLGEDVYGFDVEVDISDPNLGWIDNTPYDANNPPGPGTARILATPRCNFYDYWGPGQIREEGIELSGVNIGSPMYDGHLASFVYTPQVPGDATLKLINLNSTTTAKLENIVIHQVDTEMLMLSVPGPEEMFAVQALPQTQPEEEIDLGEIIKILEDIWLEDNGIRELVSEEKWDQFIQSIKDAAQQDL